MSVQARLERNQRFERERAVLHMRSAVVAAIAPAYLARVGSSAVLEAVDEALAQIVAADAHLGEHDQVKALWITAARRRVIDEERSPESTHRMGPVDGVARSRGSGVFAELADVTEDARARWRILEILSVLRGDQRRWAEAWFDHVLSSSRVRGGQPRGVAEALGWTPAKTKTVSRRARMKMAEFIEERSSGTVCDERRMHLDAFIMAGRHGHDLRDEPYAAVLFHVAGCEDCWAALHVRRRQLLSRGAVLVVAPFDVAAMTLQAFGAKLAGLATGAHAQASSLLARAGIGGAAAGGGAATLSGKTAAVCVGVACAAAGGEVAVVLVPRAVEPQRPLPLRAVPAHEGKPAVAHQATPAVAQTVRRAQTDAAPASRSAAHAELKARVRRASAAPRTAAVFATPGDLPPAAAAAAPAAAPATPAPTFAPPPAFASRGQPTCTPGSLGC